MQLLAKLDQIFIFIKLADAKVLVDNFFDQIVPHLLGVGALGTRSLFDLGIQTFGIVGQIVDHAFIC